MSPAARPAPRLAAKVATAAAGLLAALLAAMSPASAFADQPIFGTPTVSSHFGQAVTFSQPVTVDSIPKRVEILLTLPGSSGSEVFELPGPSNTGATTLTYSLSESDGQLLPNTPIRARWRLTDANGVQTLGPATSITYADDRFQWQSRAGSLVTIHWYSGDAEFGRRALAVAEQGVTKAEQLLGVTESKPIDFFVYADQQPFYDALGPGTRENVGGEAAADIRTLFALITPDELDASWVGVVIPHELTHLVFNTAVENPYHFPPRWLNEGLAVYLSQGYDSSDRATVASAASSRTLIPLDGLSGQFPTTADQFSQAYAESVAAVDYLIRTHGRDTFVSLIRSYAQGLTDDEAFKAAIGMTVDQFQAAWFASVGAAVPKPIGPQPAPAGVVPPGWSGASTGVSGTTPPQANGASSAAAATSPASAPGIPVTSGSGLPVVPVVLVVVALALAFGGVTLIRRSRRVSP